MRRPSLENCIDMPSPIPPNPSSEWCAISRKFQISVSLLGLAALWLIVPPLRQIAQVIVGVRLDVAFDPLAGQLGDGAHRRPRHLPGGVAGAVGAHGDRAFLAAGR